MNLRCVGALKNNTPFFSLRNYLVGRMVCLIESSDSSTSILQSKIHSALFKLQHYYLRQQKRRDYN
jgi:hypothetical protein